jgi:arylsulfatase A-like enzyme
LAFLDGHRDQRFFLVLAHYAVHTPIQAREESAAYYRRKASLLPALDGPESVPEGDRAFTKVRQDHAVYAAMIESVDESIGSLMAKLAELGLSENTVVVFTSDNGGLSTLENRRTGAPTANAPLRSGKGWLYEGGIRMPLIIWRSPSLPDGSGADRPAHQSSDQLFGEEGGETPGRSLVDQPAISMDLYPTLLGLAGLDMIPSQHLDGVNLTQLFGEHAEHVGSQLYWHFPHYHGSGNVPSGAVRVGNWKLIEWMETGRVELYDLRADVSETTNLARDMPDKAAELRQVLTDWREQVGAMMPQPNPDWESGRNE